MTDNELLALIRRIKEANATLYRHLVAMIRAMAA